jgi:hypothetical protein
MEGFACALTWPQALAIMFLHPVSGQMCFPSVPALYCTIAFDSFALKLSHPCSSFHVVQSALLSVLLPLRMSGICIEEFAPGKVPHMYPESTFSGSAHGWSLSA